MVKHNTNTAWKILKLFLAQHNIDPVTFITRILQTRKPYRTKGPDVLLRHLDYYGGEVFMNLITWDNTPEKARYWVKIHRDFQTFFRTYVHIYNNKHWNPQTDEEIDNDVFYRMYM